jgi:DNA-binding response OmpR family regulator
VVNPEERQVWVDGERVHFALQEFKMVALFIARPDVPVSPMDVCAALGMSPDSDYQKYLPPLRSHIRSKLGPELGDKHKGALRNQRGVGDYIVESLAGRQWDPSSPEIRGFADDRVQVDPLRHLVRIDDEILDNLTPSEFTIFSVAAERAGSVVTRQTIEDLGVAFTQVDPIVSGIRRILGRELRGAFRTVRNEGFKVELSLAA